MPASGYVRLSVGGLNTAVSGPQPSSSKMDELDCVIVLSSDAESEGNQLPILERRRGWLKESSCSKEVVVDLTKINDSCSDAESNDSYSDSDSNSSESITDVGSGNTVIVEK